MQERGTLGTGLPRGLQRGFWEDASSSGSRLLLQSSPADMQTDGRHTSGAEQVERVLRLAAARLSNSGSTALELQRLDSSGGSGVHLVDELVETWHQLAETQCTNGRDTRDLLHRIGAAVDSELSASLLGGSPLKPPVNLPMQKGLMDGVWDSASACDVRQRDPSSAAQLTAAPSPGVVRPPGVSVKERRAVFERRCVLLNPSMCLALAPGSLLVLHCLVTLPCSLTIADVGVGSSEGACVPCVRVCLCVRVCACVCARARACLCGGGGTTSVGRKGCEGEGWG